MGGDVPVMINVWQLPLLHGTLWHSGDYFIFESRVFELCCSSVAWNVLSAMYSVSVCAFVTKGGL